MKSFWKIIKAVIALVLIIAIVIGGYTVYEGYDLYKNAIAKISIEQKVEQIRAEENYATLSELPVDYQNAVTAVEDHRFKNHGGFDIISTGRAILTNIKEGRLVEGGSTITQQLAKNMYFTQEKKFSRKVAELFVAFNLESKYEKSDILELYVNTIYFGDGLYGIKDACKGYLKKEAINMNLGESALLAGLPNAPSVYALSNQSELSKQRQSQVLKKMVEYGYITEAQADAVKY